MYTTFNFKTKTSLREAIKRGERVTYYQPGPSAVTNPPMGWSRLRGLTTQHHIAGTHRQRLPMAS